MRTPIQAKDDLDLVLPDYVRISQAPKLETLRERARQGGIPETQAFSTEWTRRYKAISNGKVYLAQNPALMSWQHDLGRKIERVVPEFVGFYKDLLKSEGKRSDPKTKSTPIPDDPFEQGESSPPEAQRKLNF